jgi:hypothetical protein
MVVPGRQGLLVVASVLRFLIFMGAETEFDPEPLRLQRRGRSLGRCDRASRWAGSQELLWFHSVICWVTKALRPFRRPTAASMALYWAR